MLGILAVPPRQEEVVGPAGGAVHVARHRGVLEVLHQVGRVGEGEGAGLEGLVVLGAAEAVPGGGGGEG